MKILMTVTIVMTLKKILERKFGIVLKKVPDVDWYVFTGSGKDYSMLRLGSPRIRGDRPHKTLVKRALRRVCPPQGPVVPSAPRRRMKGQ